MGGEGVTYINLLAKKNGKKKKERERIGNLYLEIK